MELSKKQLNRVKIKDRKISFGLDEFPLTMSSKNSRFHIIDCSGEDAEKVKSNLDNLGISWQEV